MKIYICIVHYLTVVCDSVGRQPVELPPPLQGVGIHRSGGKVQARIPRCALLCRATRATRGSACWNDGRGKVNKLCNIIASCFIHFGS